MKYFADISNNQGNAVRPDEINAKASPSLDAAAGITNLR